MAIKYNMEKLKKTVTELCTLTGLAMRILDTKYNSLFAYESREDGFCRAVLTSPEGSLRCSSCDREMIERATEEMRPVSHICHAGLCDTAVPIIKDGVITGHILIGRVRTSNELDEATREHLLSLGISEDLITESYAKTTYLSEPQLASLKSLVSNILFDGAIEVEYNDFITRAADYIDKHLKEDLSVSRLAEALYVSKNFLYKSFRSSFGMTVSEYVSERRIKRAERLLAETDASSYEIAEAVGIESYTYFSKLFKKRRGLSPQKYRKQVKNG
ncbi:MAG: PocR ligand-binding domain-containing protein [Clostridia bacterium]|nr:PocR ligand-binding domain-containing protein [Clostridia bacterium]